MTRVRIVALAAALILAGPAAGESESACEEEVVACAVPDGEAAPGATVARREEGLVFFWGVGCPHCEAAKPFLDALARERPDLGIERVEVRQDAAGRRRFIDTMTRLGAGAAGVPAFVAGDRWVVGYRGVETEAEVRALLAREATRDTVVDLPLIGRVDAREMPLPAFTVAVGLLDGVNPCAMWVLLVLLGILGHVRSRRRLVLLGGAFVAMSGLVYFLFMTAWSAFFQLAGLSRAITMGLGAGVLIMGLINLKELFWFKRGVSLVIPERAKPGLFRRMREISRAASPPVALAGILTLAFFVNLIELGCTIGLPAVYTRILSLRAELGTGARHAYLALYNLAYVVPLALIVAVYALTLHRLTLGERGARALKGLSGALLVASGATMLFWPDLLG